MNRFLFALVSMALAAGALAIGQVAEFEVATVKPSSGAGPANIPPAILNGALGEQLRYSGGPGSRSPGRIDYLGVTLKGLLQRAYDVRANQVSGPGWIESERYDVVATLPAGTDAAGFRLMLQRLIAERFQLEMRRETRPLPVYLLTVAKGGPKLGAEEPDPFLNATPEQREAVMRARLQKTTEEARARRESGDNTPRAGIYDTGATAAKLAEALTRSTDRPVLDRTGLTQTFSYNLSYVPDNAVTQGSTGPSIYAAVEEQLGLKLQPANEPMEVIVVDRAARTPTGN